MNQKLLSVAKGETPADLVIRNGKVVNVYSGEIYDGGVAICGDTIAAVGDVEYCIGEGTRVVDAEGKYLTPGFLDGHIHPESSSLAIRPFAEAVLAHGTTGIMTDLHEVGVEAPLRETLAAAMVLLSRYRGKDPFCDPFCGSGTIPIEAALIAKNRAPGLDRSFDAQRWAFLPAKVWMDAADEAMDKEFHGHYDIWGGDIDPRAVAIARDNARKAGVEDMIRFEVADMRDFRRDSTYGQLVTNPPYGERLMEKREAEDLYRELGQVWRRQPEGWRTLVLSSHTEFERSFGRPAAKKRKLYNGMIKCDLFMYGNV